MIHGMRLVLRLSRRGLVGWAVGIAVMVTVVVLAFAEAAPTKEGATQLAVSLEPLARSFTAILGPAERLDTAGGFLTWRLLGILSVIVSIYGILKTTRVTLTDERRGATDLALSTPVSRSALFAGQALAVFVICIGISVVGMVLGWAAALGLGVELGALLRAVGAGLSMGLVAAVWSGAAALVCQFAGRRGAGAGSVAVLLALTFVVANLGAVEDGVFRALRWLSPFTYAQYFRPLVPGGPVRIWAPFALGGLTSALWAVAGVRFVHRDLNCMGQSRGRLLGKSAPDLSWLLRGPYSRDLWAFRGQALAWAFGMSFLLGLLTWMDPVLREPLHEFIRNAGILGQIFQGLLLGDEPLAVLLFGGFTGPILSVFAVLAVMRWAEDVQRGLLAPVLATSVSRVRILLCRVMAALSALALSLVVVWGIVIAIASVRGLALPVTSLARVMAGSLLSTLVFLGLGLAVASWGRLSWGAPVAGALAAANLAFDILDQVIAVPTWLSDLSVFARVNELVREPFSLKEQGVLLVAGAVLVGLALTGFWRQDVTD